MMPAAQLRDAINAEPIQPFLVRLADLRAFPVPHPEFVAIGPTNQTLVIFHEDGGAAFLDIRDITGVEIGP